MEVEGLNAGKGMLCDNNDRCVACSKLLEKGQHHGDVNTVISTPSTNVDGQTKRTRQLLSLMDAFIVIDDASIYRYKNGNRERRARESEKTKIEIEHAIIENTARRNFYEKMNLLRE